MVKCEHREDDIVGYTMSGIPITRKVAREIHEAAPAFMGDPDAEVYCCGFTNQLRRVKRATENG